MPHLSRPNFRNLAEFCGCISSVNDGETEKTVTELPHETKWHKNGNGIFAHVGGKTVQYPGFQMVEVRNRTPLLR
jgi:hypothetical protein